MLALLLLVLTLVEARADRRERASLAAMAAVPGVLDSLAEPLHEQWRLPVRSDLTGIGDLVVTVDDDALVGHEAATGGRRWSVPLVGVGALCPFGTPELAPSAPPTTLVCFGLGTPGGALGGVAAHAVDAVDGRVRTGLQTPFPLHSAVPLEQDVVLVSTGSGPVAVSRTGLGDGGDRWTADTAEPDPADLVVHADSEIVALESTTTLVLDARDGRALGRWVAASDGVTPARGRVVSHTGEGFGVWESRFSGRWYAPDATPGPSLEGEPVEPAVDDGRTPGIVLLRAAGDDRVRAVDVRSGAVRWERRAPGRLLLRLGGRLLWSGAERLEAWDARTGAVQWSVRLVPGEDPSLGEPWTDGVRLLVRGADGDDLRLSAYRLTDGDRVWRAPLPAGTRSVAVLGDRLAAVGRLDGRVESAAVLG